MAMAAIPFRPYTGVIDTSSKRYQAAKAMLDKGKATKSEAQSESETQLEKLRMLLRMLGKPLGFPERFDVFIEHMNSLPSTSV